MRTFLSEKQVPPTGGAKQPDEQPNRAVGRITVVALLVALVTASTVGSAVAEGGYSIQRSGKWYWSADLADSIYPQLQQPQPGGFKVVSTKEVLADSGIPTNSLTGRTLRQRLILQFSASPPNMPTPAWTDGTAIYSMVCVGTGSSIPSPNININLYHTFRCAVDGGRFPRLKLLQGKAAAALDRVKEGTPASTAALDALEAAEHALTNYPYKGQPVHRTITVVIDGRRDVGLVGVTPVD